MHEPDDDKPELDGGDAVSATAGSGERPSLGDPFGRINALQSILVAKLRRASEGDTTTAKLLLRRLRVDEHDPEAARLQGAGVGPPVPKGRNLVAWFRGLADCYRESAESPHPLHRENADRYEDLAAMFDHQASKLELAIDAAEGLTKSRPQSGSRS